MGLPPGRDLNSRASTSRALQVGSWTSLRLRVYSSSKTLPVEASLMMSLPKFEREPLIFPLVILASFPSDEMEIVEEILDGSGISRAQFSEGMVFSFVARILRAFGPQGSIQRVSASYR